MQGCRGVARTVYSDMGWNWRQGDLTGRGKALMTSTQAPLDEEEQQAGGTAGIGCGSLGATPLSATGFLLPATARRD